MIHWLGVTFGALRGVLKRPESHGPRFRLGEIGFFLQFLRPIWGLGFIGLICSLSYAAVSSLLPLSTKAFIDFIILKQGLDKVEAFLGSLGMAHVAPTVLHMVESLPWLLLAMAALAGLMALLGIAEQMLGVRFQQELAFNIQVALFEHILRFPLSFFRKGQVGYLTSRVSDDVDGLKYLFSQGLSQIANNGFCLLFGAGMLCALSPRLSLIALGVFPVLALANIFFSPRVRGLSRHEMESLARVDRDVHEVFSGVELVKAYAAEEEEVRRVAQTMRAAVRARIRAVLLYVLSNFAARGIQFSATLLAMWFGAREIRAGRMTVGDYVAFATYVIYLGGAVRSLSLLPTSLQPVLACVDRLMELFRIIPEFGKAPRDLATLPRIRGEIRFDRVGFQYERGEAVLRDVTFTARPGDVIVLLGPSGSGKTTLTNLLLKFYRPQHGAIYLDGIDLIRIDARWLREQIGVVSQETFLFHGTVEENIRYGRPGATRAQVETAARKAHIHARIEELPQGYGTRVGERGAELSVGERQRISLARAFLKAPPLLIFDEPTSALDPDSERQIKDSLRELARDRTTFIISHRMSMLDVGSRVFLLNRGLLSEHPPGELPFPTAGPP
jgi:subfamily B ATP-binding cassette protein MsbA